MASTSKDKFKLLYILVLILLASIIFSRIPTLILNLYNGNSTEVAANTEDTVSLILSAGSFIVAFIAMLLTNDSLEITQKVLQRTEIEEQKRDIEQRLELFYYPMSYYFKIAVGQETKEGLNEDDRRERVRAYQCRFKADERTREQLEEWYKHITNSLEPGKVKTGKAQVQQDLITYISEDIVKYNNRIQDLNKQIQALTTDKRIETEVVKKPRWKFW